MLQIIRNEQTESRFPRSASSFLKLRVGSSGMEDGSGTFAMEIAAALQRAAAQSGLHVKKVAAWTGANERTVKNWFSGQYGPSGEHLIVLARHCNEVFTTVLISMGRQDLLIEHEIFEIEQRIARLSARLKEIKPESH